MALFNKRPRRKLLAEMNVVPYIDVMLVLVVILMVAAPFVNPSVVNLPSVSKASKAPDKPVEVIVYTNGKVSIRQDKNLTPVSLAGLVDAVKSVSGDDAKTPVVILADKEVRYETVIEALKTLQSGGFERVGLALKLEGRTR